MEKQHVDQHAYLPDELLNMNGAEKNKLLLEKQKWDDKHPECGSEESMLPDSRQKRRSIVLEKVQISKRVEDWCQKVKVVK